MEKILIVEDDNEIAQIEADYLRKSEYEVMIAKDGEQAIKLFVQEEPELVILDLNLPLINGYNVCQQIREKSGVPIIMVTAKTKEIDELLGLELGADDYIKKPFSPKVLVSRVKALLKRPLLRDNSKSTIEISDFIMNLEKRTLSMKGESLPFTTIQFNMFAEFLQNPGKVFTRDDLMDRSYDSGDLVDIFDRTIDSHIKNIRKLIETNPKKPKYIITVRGVGYKFNE